jgi:hypothetical protein
VVKMGVLQPPTTLKHRINMGVREIWSGGLTLVRNRAKEGVYSGLSGPRRGGSKGRASWVD